MKNNIFLLCILSCLTIFSCSTTSKISKQSTHNKSLCKDLVWYNFIDGKPSIPYLKSSEKVAEKWGFKIVYTLGSCTNNEEDKKKDSISKEKSIPLFKCLTKNVGENWESKFREEVEIERKK